MRNLLSRFWGTILIAIFLFIGGAYFMHMRNLSASVSLDVAPSMATIRLDNKVLSPGTYRIKPGNHTVSFRADGFYAVKQTINILSGQHANMAQALQPSTPDTADWYNTHPADQKKAESISSQNVDTAAAQQLSEAPFLKQLPYINLTPYFKIDYGVSQKHPNDAKAFAIYIYANSNDAQNQALAWIKQQGTDPSKLEIIYP